MKSSARSVLDLQPGDASESRRQYECLRMTTRHTPMLQETNRRLAAAVTVTRCETRTERLYLDTPVPALSESTIAFTATSAASLVLHFPLSSSGWASAYGIWNRLWSRTTGCARAHTIPHYG